MMKLSILLLLLGYYSAEASVSGYKVEDYAEEELEEEDEDWSASAKLSAQRQSEKDQLKYLNMMQKAEAAQEKTEDGEKLTQADVSEFAELAEEDSSVAQMRSKLSKLEKMAALQQRWKQLADELHAARVEEFLDEVPQMPKTLLGLEAEVARLENIKKVEGLEKEERQKESAYKAPTNLLQVNQKSEALVDASRERRLHLSKLELASLKEKVEANDAAVAESMKVLDKAEMQMSNALENLADSEQLWKESEKELRGRDKEWAQKERAHLEKQYETVLALKENAEKNLALNKLSEEELSGQQMLTTVSLAMQEAQPAGASLDETLQHLIGFTDTLKSELDKNELDVGDFLRYAKKEKNPQHLAGWGLFKRGPASINAAPIASALLQLESTSTADELAGKLYESLNTA